MSFLEGLETRDKFTQKYVNISKLFVKIGSQQKHEEEKLRDYLMLLVVISPLLCAAIGYGLEGSWQGALVGVCSGMLLGGVLRRLLMGPIYEETANSEPTPGHDHVELHRKEND